MGIEQGHIDRSRGPQGSLMVENEDAWRALVEVNQTITIPNQQGKGLYEGMRIKLLGPQPANEEIDAEVLQMISTKDPRTFFDMFQTPSDRHFDIVVRRING